MTMLACNICVWAIFDYLLPPLGFWMLFSTSWLLSNSVVAIRFKTEFPIHRNISLALVMILGAFVLFALTGLPFFLLLIPVAAFGFLKFLGDWKNVQYPVKLRRVVLVVGAIHIIALSYGAGLTYRVRATRTDAQYVARWGNLGAGKGLFEKMRGREPQSLDEYRFIVRSRRHQVVESAQRIAAISNDPADIDLIESVLRSNAFRMGEFEKEELKQSLEQLRTRLWK